MKLGYCLFLLFLAVTCIAAPPSSVTLESGNIRLRLDEKKRWNINRIEFCGERLGKDSPYAHYGMTCRPADFKYAVGSGHEESGFGEQVISIKFYAGNKEVFPEKGVTIHGTKLKVEKISKILTLDVKYNIVLDNDKIYESIEAVSNKDMKLHHLYFFMHPWEPRFSELYISNSARSIRTIPFKSNQKFVNRKFVRTATFFDKKSGIGAITTYRNIKGEKKMMRLIWDRPQYRKDYLCDYFMSVLPKNHVIAYEAETSFYKVNTKQNSNIQK